VEVGLIQRAHEDRGFESWSWHGYSPTSLCCPVMTNVLRKAGPPSKECRKMFQHPDINFDSDQA